MSDTLMVSDAGVLLRFTVADLMRYHGPGFPGGVAHAFKVMQRGLPMLAAADPPERREIRIETAFPGPGARDAFEMVTRAVTGGRYLVDEGLVGVAAPTSATGRYLFRLIHRDLTVTLTLRPGHVRDEFIALSRQANRSEAEEQRLTDLKQEMSERLLQTPAEDVYDALVEAA